ncbi:MAG: hypothetical protein AABX45_01550 [Nanoarchaeota archaeon]
MHKKGDSLLEKQLIFAFYLILAVVVYFIIGNVVSEKSYFEDYFVRDLGLTIDTLHNSPGNINVYYPNLNDLNLVIKENLVGVNSLIKATPKSYLFTRDKNFKQLDYNFNFINNTLKISKDKDIYLEIKNE